MEDLTSPLNYKKTFETYKNNSGIILEWQVRIAYACEVFRCYTTNYMIEAWSLKFM